MRFEFQDTDLKTMLVLDVKEYEFKLDSPDDAMAKTEKNSAILTISGHLKDKDFEISEKLVKWALTSSKKKEAYRKAVFYNIKDSNVARRIYEFPNAFVVDFSEKNAEGDDMTEYRLIIKQKFDKMEDLLCKSNEIVESEE